MIKRVTISLCLFLFFAGCDEFARFKQEKMECQTRLFGPVELVFKSRKLDANVQITGGSLKKNLRIVDRGNTSLVAKGHDLSAEIDFQKNRVTLRIDNKLESVSCRYHSFKM